MSGGRVRRWNDDTKYNFAEYSLMILIASSPTNIFLPMYCGKLWFCLFLYLTALSRLQGCRGGGSRMDGFLSVQ